MALFITMFRTQHVLLFANPLLDGQTAPLVSDPVWSLDNGSLANLVPAEDGSTCDVVAKGPTGILNVTCTAFGTQSLTGVVQITIISDFADTLDITSGNPVPQ